MYYLERKHREQILPIQQLESMLKIYCTLNQAQPIKMPIGLYVDLLAIFLYFV
jgi:hypothetical protein